MWVDLNPVTADVEPGAEATVELIYGVLRNRHTGTCLSAKGAGQWLTAAPCNTGDQNQWFWLFAL